MRKKKLEVKQQPRKTWKVSERETHDRTVEIKNPAGECVARFHRDRDGDVEVHNPTQEDWNRERGYGFGERPKGPQSIPLRHLKSAIDKISESNP